MSEPSVCAKCGTPLAPDDQFCLHCGTPRAAEEPGATPTAAPPPPRKGFGATLIEGAVTIFRKPSVAEAETELMERVPVSPENDRTEWRDERRRPGPSQIRWSAVGGAGGLLIFVVILLARGGDDAPVPTPAEPAPAAAEPSPPTPAPTAPATLIVTGIPLGGRLTVNGQPQSATQFQFQPGTYVIEMTADGYLPTADTVRLEPGARRELTIDAQPSGR